MRAVIRSFDRWLARRYGVFEFNQQPDCILRLQRTRAAHAMQLPEVSIQAGEPVLGLHLWNDHVPNLPATGPDLAWATHTVRLYLHSLHLVAAYVEDQPHLTRMRALVGVTSLFAPPDKPGEEHPMGKMGFTVVSYHSPLGGFGDFWENFYAWWIMWAYNPASVRGRNLFRLRRSEMWMSMQAFLHRYGVANISEVKKQNGAA